MDINENKNLTNCKACGQPIAKSAKVCPNCGSKNTKPIYKRGWFIALCIIFVLGIIGSARGGSSNGAKTQKSAASTASTAADTQSAAKENTSTEKAAEPVEIVYESYAISDMMDDLNSNALKAENKYNKQYVEITGKLSVIDSSGRYISLVRSDDPYAIVGVQCYMKNDEQKNQVMEMSVGDSVTVRGKITNVGEVLGYSLNIDEIVE